MEAAVEDRYSRDYKLSLHSPNIARKSRQRYHYVFTMILIGKSN
jgi:hypothetical protein